MKLTTTLIIALILCSIKSYADESYTVDNLHTSEPYQYLAINSSAVIPILLVHELTINAIDSLSVVELPTQISAKINNQLLSIAAGVMQSNEMSNWSKYYFQGALTLHQYKKFNLAVMANIEQLNNFHSPYLVNNKDQTTYLENQAMSNETEVNYSYGLVGSYSVNSTWQFSGGIIHAQTFNEVNSTTWYGNKNMALIGTTYSF